MYTKNVYVSALPGQTKVTVTFVILGSTVAALTYELSSGGNATLPDAVLADVFRDIREESDRERPRLEEIMRELNKPRPGGKR